MRASAWAFAALGLLRPAAVAYSPAFVMPQPVQYIETFHELAHWCSRLVHATEVAIDTEADSFFRYREKTCLIQMTAFGDDVIIDPLAISDLSPLAAVLADAGCVKILHDATYDLLSLRRDYGFVFVNIFDTMLASRFLGAKHFGLAAQLKERFDFNADKRYQRSDWSRRPLTEGQLTYARFDTHYLPALRAQQQSELEACGRLEWAQQEFARLPGLAERSTQARGPSLGFWKVAGAKTLSPSARGRLRSLFIARNRIAQKLDRPTFKVVADEVLLALAISPPAEGEMPAPQSGLREQALRRFGKELVAGLHDALPIDDEPPKVVAKRRRSGRTLEPAARERYELLREARRKAAESVGLEPEVTLGNAALEQLAKEPPLTREAMAVSVDLLGWRAPVLLEPLWAALVAAAEAESRPPEPAAPRPRRTRRRVPVTPA